MSDQATTSAPRKMSRFWQLCHQMLPSSSFNSKFALGKVIELDRHHVMVDNRVVHHLSADEHLNKQDRQFMQRLLTCAVSCRAIWVDLQWPTVTVQRQLLTLNSLLNAFHVNDFRHLQLLSIRIEGVTEWSVNQMCDLVNLLPTGIKLELWLHACNTTDRSLCKILCELERIERFQTIALTGMPVTVLLLKALLSAINNKPVRRLMIGDCVQPCGPLLAALVNNISSGCLQYLHVWSVMSSFYEGFLTSVSNQAVAEIDWVHMVAYDNVPLPMIPNSALLDMATIATHLESIDIGFHVGDIKESEFVDLVNQWLNVIVEHDGPRQLQITCLNINLPRPLSAILTDHWPNAEALMGTSTSEWQMSINWTPDRVLKMSSAHDLRSFANKCKHSHLKSLMARNVF